MNHFTIRNPGRLIAGMPTSGKSHLQAAVNAGRIILLDTDDAFEVSMPNLSAQKPWRPGSGATDLDRDLQFHVVNAMAKEAITAGFSLITNFWGEEFARAVREPDIAFLRSAAAITRLSSERGGATIPEDIATQWVKEREGDQVAQHFVQLGDDEFVSDYVTFADKLETVEPSEPSILLRLWIEATKKS